MPTNKRARSVVVELSEKLVDIGYDVTEVIGPLDNDGDEVDPEVVVDDTTINYYLTAEGAGVAFYITLGTDREYAEIVYQMHVVNHLANYLDMDEIDAILDEQHDWDDLNPTEQTRIAHDAVGVILENSDAYNLHRAAFNLSAYASSAIVDYHPAIDIDPFPQKYQSVKRIFPFTEGMSLRQLEEAVRPVIIAGERGRRYVQYSFHLDTEDKSPDEYKFRIAF